jgi:regulator of protease activity HflC (stomatin/prohibitin superfamily)
MSFPLPNTPGEWQNAYTRDQAHRDSSKFESAFILPLVVCALFALAYTLFRAARFLFSPDIGFLEPWTPLTIAIAVFIIISTLVIFAIMQRAAFVTAQTFFSEFYKTPSGVSANEIIGYRLQGRSKLPDRLSMLSQFKYILIKDGEIAKSDKWPAWAAQNIGGPLMLIVFDGYALYLERGNRFSRIVGPGSAFLEWYETIKEVVDLRPKIVERNFDVWTKDGIKIKIFAKIECRIGDPTKKPPAADLVFPYDPMAVKEAVERKSLRWPDRLTGEPGDFTWIDAAWGQVTGIVPGYIGGRWLDDLFMAERGNGQILSTDALTDIFTRHNKSTKAFGVYITDFQIQKIEFPKEVIEHQNKHWKTEKQGVTTRREGSTKASRILITEKERTDALRNLILTIATGLDRKDDEKFIESLLLSLPGFLDEGIKSPVLRAYVANQKLDTLDQLKRLSNPPPD